MNMSIFRKRFLMVILSIIITHTVMARPLDNPYYVILITIDGLRSEMIDDPMMPSPFLKMMSRDGLRINRVIGIPPAATYPSHTTLVTGEVPAKHRVFYNRPFLWNKDTARISYWYADSIAVPTIWQHAHEAGMKTASLFWPVSTIMSQNSGLSTIVVTRWNISSHRVRQKEFLTNLSRMLVEDLIRLHIKPALFYVTEELLPWQTI